MNLPEGLEEEAKNELKKLAGTVAKESIAFVGDLVTDTNDRRLQNLQANVQTLRAELLYTPGDSLLEEMVADAEASLKMALETEGLVRDKAMQNHVNEVLNMTGQVGLKVALAAVKAYLPRVI